MAITSVVSRSGSRRAGKAFAVLALAGLVLGASTTFSSAAKAEEDPSAFWPTKKKADRYSYFKKLPKLDPRTPLEADEMRISFMGSAIPPVRRAQQMMSVFVEVGWDAEKGKPLDQFVFDCGSGVSANYGAMGVGFSRMNKIFLAHLHADHMSDLIHIYCFGPSGDRKSPQYVWGHGPSNVPNPGNDPALHPAGYYGNTPAYYDDGTRAFCENLRAALRWHTESFSFQGTGYASYSTPEEVQVAWGLPSLPLPVGDDSFQDAYALIPIELDWGTVGGVAYHNEATGAKVTHFPVIHCRQGSMGYKVEWRNPKVPGAPPRTMIYTSDTKPERISIEQAINGGAGVDVFIHEMIVPAEVWAMKNQGLSEPGNMADPVWAITLQAVTNVQNSSHTPQGAFGYLLSQITPRPRLTVATHFPVADDTVACALKSVQEHCPDIKKIGDPLTWSFDLMVIRVFPDRIQQCRAKVSDFTFSPPTSDIHDDMYVPKYHNPDGSANAFGQIDRTNEIPPTEQGGDEGNPSYREDGY